MHAGNRVVFGMECRVLVPVNLVARKGNVVGLDAYFWPLVSLLRRMMLVFPEHVIEYEHGEGVVLAKRVDVGKQLDDARRVLSTAQRFSRPPSVLRLIAVRLASLLLPGSSRVVSREARRIVLGNGEEGLSLLVAGALVEARPLGRIGWIALNPINVLRGVPEARTERVYVELIKLGEQLLGREFSKIVKSGCYGRLLSP